MELLFCGTAAAEALPALFCTCKVCQVARERGGKEIRSRTGYMLGDKIKIDFSPDANLHHHKYGLEYEKLEHLVVTHSHDDHWFVHDLAYRKKGFAVVADEPLHVWGNDKVEQKFIAVNSDDWAKYHLVFHRITAFETFNLSDGVKATPILAAHDRSEACMNYVFEIDGRRTLLGHDTGWYDEPTWEFLADKPLHCIIFDCTYGIIDHEPNHMGGAALIRAREELTRRNALAENAVCIATHFSHNAGSLHDELENFFNPQGFMVSYDGFKVTL